MDLIRFGMSSTLISFDRDYYEYSSGKKYEQGLAIGGYESAFLADLVASYTFETSKAILNLKTYHGIYWDDGLVVFKGKKSAKKLNIC